MILWGVVVSVAVVIYAAWGGVVSLGVERGTEQAETSPAKPTCSTGRFRGV